MKISHNTPHINYLNAAEKTQPSKTDSSLDGLDLNHHYIENVLTGRQNPYPDNNPAPKWFTEIVALAFQVKRMEVIQTLKAMGRLPSEASRWTVVHQQKQEAGSSWIDKISYASNLAISYLFSFRKTS